MTLLRQIFPSSAPCYPVGAQCARNPDLVGDSRLSATFNGILSSPPVLVQKQLLARLGKKLNGDLILWKYLPGPTLRVIFTVTGDVIEEGAVVALVVLHDLERNRTLYAHPMHAGPGVNPLLANLDGPMSHPKAQPGKDGDRATRRMIEHKRSLWARFCQDRKTVGSIEAGRRWKAGYNWALRRLYFCSRCPECKWGTPSFEGPVEGQKPTIQREPLSPRPFPALHEEDARMVAKVLKSEPWIIESAYAARGHFQVLNNPYVIQPMDPKSFQLVFPISLDHIQAGTLVALAVTYHAPSETVLHAHCLSAGPEPEILFLCGDTALGLPIPKGCSKSAAALAIYVDWRREAWTRFWLDELEGGIRVASRAWLEDFWRAMENLLGGNRLAESA